MFRQGEHGAPGSAQAAVVVRNDEFDPAQPAGGEAFEKRPPMDLGLRQGHRYAENAAALIRADARVEPKTPSSWPRHRAG